MASEALRIRDLVSGYRGLPALHGISLEVSAGEMVALVGANGAGKSTLLRSIAGLSRPVAGSIELEGRRIDAMAAHRIARLGIAYVPEGRRLFARLSVIDNLLLGAWVRGETDPAEVFSLFPVLRDRARQIAGTLSGGEQQMLAIGRALMSKPRLLLLDEPSLGIAPRLVARIYQTLKEINQRGLTVLLVEQNVRAALQIASRAYVLQTGRIVSHGLSAELLGTDLVRKAFLGI
ncbi:MAG: ABC transporter ATP-binding protein [Myxococcales bacterium]|nr:ABC transporter ATP-binding protein [Myxococcales bacterium]